MAETTEISWCDATFNPWIGCTKVAPGCTHCYAEAFAKRTGKAKWGPGGTRVLTSDAYWKNPLKWNKQAEAAGVRKRVFCASLADVFEDWSGNQADGVSPKCMVNAKGEPLCTRIGIETAVQWPTEPGWRPLCMINVRERLFRLIDATPNLDWLLLTKRPENIRKMWPSTNCWGLVCHASVGTGIVCPDDSCDVNDGLRKGWRDNVWLGTTVTDQETADRNIPQLIQCGDLCPVRFLSCEPLLGPVILHKYFADCQCGRGHGFTACPNTGGVAQSCSETGCEQLRPNLHWVIVGSESGHHRRPMNPMWAESIRQQCKSASVSFFMKQMEAAGKVSGDMNKFPQSLRVREFPNVHVA